MRTDDNKWRAVLGRDAAANGSFVYAVRSTHIYCRPTCPSRRPRREQVVFFDDMGEAEKAGFRPCRRCKPREVDSRLQLIDAVRGFLAERLDEPVTLDQLGRQFHVSPYHLQKTFKQLTGVTPRQYSDSLRLSAFKSQLRRGADITTALYDVGYGSSRGIYERAPAHLGMTPATYRRGGRGMHIRYTIVDCRLGKMLVGGTELGICAVQLGDSESELERTLADEYHEALVERDRAAMEKWVRALLRNLDGTEPHLDLPLDLRATAFQLRVWEALRRIPFGITRSYAEIATDVGQPRAVRAVANACAANPAALVIPCHRVVQSGGDPGGYRWGAGRKRQLLESERKATLESALTHLAV